MPTVASPLLTADRVSAVIEACGYRSVAAVIAGSRTLPPGCAVSLQFGDEITVAADGEACLTIRCSLRINGEDDLVAGVTCWQIRKSVRRAIATDRPGLAIDADLLLGSGVTLADILMHGGDACRHLHRLIADARDTLRNLTIDDAPGDGGPAMRIEASFFGDLAVGRSGVVPNGGSGISARHGWMTGAACDWLVDALLPDLARAVRATILPASPTVSCLAEADAVLEPHARPTCIVDSATIMPAQERGQ